VVACLTALLVAALLATSPATLSAAKRKVVRPKVIPHWVPAARTSWQWEIDHPLNVHSASDMSTNGTLYTGARASAPQVYDIDGFDNTAGSVNLLHREHKRVICYLSVGTWESWRPDASTFPGALLGNADPGWTGERYLDIGPSPYYGKLQAIMYHRLEMCRSKHFDGVEFDNMDVAENDSGFNITIAQDNAYVRWLAAKAHSLGLAAGQKNYVDQSGALVRSMDFMISEQCFQYGDCDQVAPYLRAHKAVFEAEYQDQGADPKAYCPASNRLNLNTDEFVTNLDGSLRVTCR
jgi:hypothetical protein